MKRLLPLAVFSLMLAACNAQTPTVTGTDSSAPAAKRVAMEWWAKNTGTNDTGAPHNILTLRTVTEPPTTLFETECTGMTLVEGVPDMDDSVATIQCWWAGGGDQFGVFIGDGEKAVVRHRTVDEEAGYGNWVDLKTL